LHQILQEHQKFDLPNLKLPSLDLMWITGPKTKAETDKLSLSDKFFLAIALVAIVKLLTIKIFPGLAQTFSLAENSF
jgi:hypothetical protein